MAPITLSGFNNIDFKSIVDAIVQFERQPITRLQAQQKTEQSRLTAYGSLTTSLSGLQEAFAALESPSVFGELQATTSDATVLTAAATAAAVKGTFSINVLSLARPQVTASAARQFSDINTPVIDGGSFALTQDGVTTSIDLTGVTTLSQLRDAVNAQQTGVKASIINDGSTQDVPPKPFRLILTSTSPGAAKAFTVDDQTTFSGGASGSALNLSTDPTNGVARDTELQYNGIAIKSSSTTVSSAIPGLTLTPLKIGATTVTISADDSSLKAKINHVVDAFNSFSDFAQAQFKLAVPGTPRAPLATDPLLRSLNRQIRSYLISNHPNSGNIQNLTAVGIKLKQNGKLEIDALALDEALSGNPDGMKAFLSDTSGLAAKIGDALGALSGSIDTVESNIKTTIESYDTRIFTMESQMVLRQDALTKQFAAADKAISQLNSQGNALNALGSQYRLF